MLIVLWSFHSIQTPSTSWRKQWLKKNLTVGQLKNEKTQGRLKQQCTTFELQTHTHRNTIDWERFADSWTQDSSEAKSVLRVLWNTLCLSLHWRWNIDRGARWCVDVQIYRILNIHLRNQVNLGQYMSLQTTFKLDHICAVDASPELRLPSPSNRPVGSRKLLGSWVVLHLIADYKGC